MTVRKSITGLTLIFSIFLAGVSFAFTHVVYPDGSGDYTNIQEALDAAVDGDTVALADGIFAGRGNRDLRYYGKQLVVCSQSGNADACTIDVQGEQNEIAERGFIFDNDEGYSSILQDLTIINGSADGPCPACEGAGVYVDHSSPTLVNLVLRDNYAANGAGIMCLGGTPVIEGCTFVNNEAFDGAGLMCLDGTVATATRCLFYDNHADVRGAGVSLQTNCVITLVNCTISNNEALNGSGIATWDSDYILQNTIISFNGEGASLFVFGDSSDVSVSYCDIYSNSGGDWVEPIDDQLGISGNISGDPLFADTADANFTLTENSPCIDAGDPESPLDPDSTIADMGAFFYNQATDIEDEISALPEVTELFQNYPNPFNLSTSVSFNLKERSHVLLDIYDILGRRVATLIDNMREPGSYRVTWNADVGTGIYFYRLVADDYSSTKKMVLIK
jgi:hypothetical protein